MEIIAENLYPYFDGRIALGILFGMVLLIGFLYWKANRGK